MKIVKNKISGFLLYYALIPFIASIPFLFTPFLLDEVWLETIGVGLVVLLIYFIFRKKMDFKTGLYANGIALCVLSVIFTVMMIFASGNTDSVIIQNFCWIVIQFAPIMPLSLLMGDMIAILTTVFLTYMSGYLFCLIKTKNKIKKALIPVGFFLICFACCVCLYTNRPNVKYGGHGFEYMHGYSSTDFTDYMVYADDSKLVVLDHEPSLIIENEEDMPVLDGAEACYPLYAAFAKACYKDIDKIEMSYLNTDADYNNGKIVTFTNTIYGFDRLICGGLDIEKFDEGVDMFFGAKPSAEQLQDAKDSGVEIEITPIGKEAFVFFVEEDNPVNGLSSDDIRSIYHGDMDNWKNVGGNNQKIRAFQRPRNSGSQTMMTYFMKDVSLKEPLTYETIGGMGEVIRQVAQYSNEDGAIGYTFRYFLEGLNQEKGVKMLEVDGVYPTVENIENGTYPLTVDLCLITRKNDPNPYVEKMKEFILSEDGQYIIRQTGYGGLGF